MKKIISLTNAVGMTAFIAAVILKSIYFLNLISFTVLGSKFLLVIGLLLMSVSFFIKIIEPNTDTIKRIFNLLFSIFLIGNVFFQVFLPGANIMLSLVLVIIPSLITLLLINKKTVEFNSFSKNDLIWILVILFTIIFYLITWMIHLNSIYLKTITFPN